MCLLGRDHSLSQQSACQGVITAGNGVEHLGLNGEDYRKAITINRRYQLRAAKTHHGKKKNEMSISAEMEVMIKLDLTHDL